MTKSLARKYIQLALFYLTPSCMDRRRVSFHTKKIVFKLLECQVTRRFFCLFSIGSSAICYSSY